MANKYGQAMDEMEARCELLNAGQTREECCKQPGKDCSLPLSSHSVPASSLGGQDYAEIGGLVVVGATLLALLFVAVRRKWFSSFWRSELAKAMVAGWFIWVGIVASYVLLLRPYGSRMYDDDYESLFLWATLPPLCAIAIVFWVRRFAIKKL